MKKRFVIISFVFMLIFIIISSIHIISLEIDYNRLNINQKTIIQEVYKSKIDNSELYNYVSSYGVDNITINVYFINVTENIVFSQFPDTPNFLKNNSKRFEYNGSSLKEDGKEIFALCNMKHDINIEYMNNPQRGSIYYEIVSKEGIELCNVMLYGYKFNNREAYSKEYAYINGVPVYFQQEYYDVIKPFVDELKTNGVLDNDLYQ